LRIWWNESQKNKRRGSRYEITHAGCEYLDIPFDPEKKIIVDEKGLKKMLPARTEEENKNV
jgi:hypothetical protein